VKRSDLHRRAALRRVPFRRPRLHHDPVWAAVRKVVWERARGRCERCETGLYVTTWHAHHVKLRSRGGTDDPANLVALCPPCHRWVHANPTLAENEGWMLASWLEEARRSADQARDVLRVVDP
jgi:5-methylcytosine-specific restriction endonuclease McrA